MIELLLTAEIGVLKKAIWHSSELSWPQLQALDSVKLKEYLLGLPLKTLDEILDTLTS